MEFKIIDITSASKIKVKSATITTVIIPTNEVLSLDEDEVGILEGRFSHHWKGAYFQGGIINPGWSGKITAELLVFGEFEVEQGESVAHAIIFKGINVFSYIYKGRAPWQQPISIVINEKIERVERSIGTDRVVVYGENGLGITHGDYQELREAILAASYDGTKFYHRVTPNNPDLPVEQIEVSKNKW